MVDYDIDDVPQEPLSKSALKREMHALQALGKQLIDLPDSHLARMPLSEDMRDAIALYKRLKQHEARRRQLQYIGKHMPKEAVDAIRAELEALENENKLFRQHFHLLEELRDRLISAGDEAVQELVSLHPELEIQQLRNLIRQARKEASQGNAPTASRKLFRFLRDNIPVTGVAAPGEDMP